MGRRSDFARLPQDAYQTPSEAVGPLLPHLRPRTKFIEPCRGEGKLIAHLTAAGHACVASYDLPDDARSKRYDIPCGAIFLTNCPWSRPILHEIIVNLSRQAPAWLLIDAEWLHTRQSVPYLPRLRIIVSIGRIKWIPDSPYTGKDSCCWCLFDATSAWGPTRFYGRLPADRPQARPQYVPLKEAAE
jgi:hypothetical protein